MIEILRWIQDPVFDLEKRPAKKEVNDCPKKLKYIYSSIIIKLLMKCNIKFKIDYILLYRFNNESTIFKITYKLLVWCYDYYRDRRILA